MRSTTMAAIGLSVWTAGVAAAGHPVVEKKTLTREGARKVIVAVIAEATRNNAGAAVAVVDEGGNLIAVERLDGTFAAGTGISIGKARTAALFQRPTNFFEEVIRKGRTPMVALNDFTPLQGGVPILMDGKVVGAVGVSGASSAQQDEEFAIAGAKALGSPAMHSAVTYFPSEQVEQAFRKGAILFDAGERYMVHASRREAPGMAEVHEQDTDIVYVLDGVATLVTGGTALQTKETAPGEFRGSGIDGGESRQISKGDVVVVPAGTPHWFQQVRGPFLYYVVKVR